MTIIATAHTDVPDSAAAGRALGEQFRDSLRGAPDALILFASPRYDFPAFLQALHDACAPAVLVGASSSGEFISGTQDVDTACGLAIRSDCMQFAAGLGRGLRRDRVAAGRALVSTFRGLRDQPYPYRGAMLLTDSLAGYAEDLVDQVVQLTGGNYRLFGGGAGGDDSMQRRIVFCGTEAYSDAAVALEILSSKPIGISVRHGWAPVGEAYRVTETAGQSGPRCQIGPLIGHLTRNTWICGLCLWREKWRLKRLYADFLTTARLRHVRRSWAPLTRRYFSLRELAPTKDGQRLVHIW